MVFFVALCVCNIEGEIATPVMDWLDLKQTQIQLHLLKFQQTLTLHYNLYIKDRVVYITIRSEMYFLWHYTPKNIKRYTDAHIYTAHVKKCIHEFFYFLSSFCLELH